LRVGRNGAFFPPDATAGSFFHPTRPQEASVGKRPQTPNVPFSRRCFEKKLNCIRNKALDYFTVSGNPMTLGPCFSSNWTKYLQFCPSKSQMNTEILISNLTNPVLLFFLLGVLAAVVKSDLQIPEPTIKFISLYLLFSIGFRGGQELAHSGFTNEIIIILISAALLACLVPLYTFFILKTRLSVSDAGAVAAAFGSVSAVTFVAASGFLENRQVAYGGYMVAAMALMEAPAIIIGVLLMRHFQKNTAVQSSIGKVAHEAFTNGSVLMIMGSLVIGMISDEKQAKGIEPFTSDIFKGFLAVFLLEMGMVAANRFKSFRNYGWFATLFALVIPLFNGMVTAWLSGYLPLQDGDRLLLSVLAASASYIAVPAAMRHAAPDADPGLYIPMALGVTFPLNITVGIPLYWSLIA
jgi:hypothetical protein